MKMEVDAKMCSSFEGVLAYRIQETGKHEPLYTDSLSLGLVYDPQGLTIYLAKDIKGLNI
jgi:hypothetical protein